MSAMLPPDPSAGGGLPPDLMGALGGAPGGAPPGPGGGLPPGMMGALGGADPENPVDTQSEHEPATLDNLLEHAKMALQMAQELSTGSTDPHEQNMLAQTFISPLSKIVAGHAKATLGGGGGG